jgi:hypothetical protein
MPWGGRGVWTFECQLDDGHEGAHQEHGHWGYVKPVPYAMTWEDAEAPAELNR